MQRAIATKSGVRFEDLTAEEMAEHSAGIAAQYVAARRNEIAARLAAIDLDSVRALRAKVAGRGGPFEDNKLSTLEDEAAALRAELATLGV